MEEGDKTGSNAGLLSEIISVCVLQEHREQSVMSASKVKTALFGLLH